MRLSIKGSICLFNVLVPWFGFAKPGDELSFAHGFKFVKSLRVPSHGLIESGYYWLAV